MADPITEGGHSRVSRVELALYARLGGLERNAQSYPLVADMVIDKAVSTEAFATIGIEEDVWAVVFDAVTLTMV